MALSAPLHGKGRCVSILLWITGTKSSYFAGLYLTQYWTSVAQTECTLSVSTPASCPPPWRLSILNIDRPTTTYVQCMNGVAISGSVYITDSNFPSKMFQLLKMGAKHAGEVPLSLPYLLYPFLITSDWLRVLGVTCTHTVPLWR